MLSGEKLETLPVAWIFMGTAPCTDIIPPTSRVNLTAMSAGNFPMRSTTSVPGYAKGPLLEVHNDGACSPSPSIRPENRDTNRSPRTIIEVTLRTQRSRLSPATYPTGSRWLLLQSVRLLSRCFFEKKPLSKPRMYKPCDASVRPA